VLAFLQPARTDVSSEFRSAGATQMASC
jgi:hypothetical protein